MLASNVTPHTVDNHNVLALRWLTAYDRECQTAEKEWWCIPNESHHGPYGIAQREVFHTCAHCAYTIYQWPWKKWTPWNFRIVYFPQATISHWANQVPPPPVGHPDHDAARTKAYNRCEIMGSESDDYGQYIPGRTTYWQEYYVRAEETPVDDKLVSDLRRGSTWNFPPASQPPITRPDIATARRKWLASDIETRKRLIDEYNKEAGRGEHTGRPRRWRGPLNFAPTHAITPQYEFTKSELELRRKDENDPSSVYTVEHDKHRVISNVSLGGSDINRWSMAETATQYATPDSLAHHAQPGGTLARVDEPEAFKHQGVYYMDHSAVTIIIPGSLDEEGDEDYAQATNWIFGGALYPAAQMVKAHFHNRARQRGFGKTTYEDKLVRATPCDTKGDWTDIIMDDYGSVWSSMSEGIAQSEEMHDLLTILGPSSKKKKLVLVSFANDVKIEASFGGAAFYLYHPMHRPAYYKNEQRKIVKYTLLIQQVLKVLRLSEVAGAQGTGRCKHKMWEILVGCLNYCLYYTSLHHYLIEIILELWPDHKSWDGRKVLWTQRGDPCLSKARKGKRMVVDWMPVVPRDYQHPKGLVLTPSVKSIQLLEKIARELPERNGVRIYTGLPLQGRWRGQVAQSNEELMALPKGEYFTTEGIPFGPTDATKKVGAQVTGKREIAIIKFDGIGNIMSTEARALILLLVHSENEFLPPMEQRSCINDVQWFPPGSNLRRVDTDPNGPPQWIVDTELGKAFYAAGRILGLVDNQAVVFSWNKGWSLNPLLNEDVRYGIELTHQQKSNVALRYINTHINFADGPTRGKGHPFTQCIWFTDTVWNWLVGVLGLSFTAEGYADQQNARMPTFCSIFNPFGDAILNGHSWFVNCPWTDVIEALECMEQAKARGEIFEFAFVLAKAPSLTPIRKIAIAKLIQLGARADVKFPANSSIFQSKGTRYTDDRLAPPCYKLFDVACAPTPWPVTLWITGGAWAQP